MISVADLSPKNATSGTALFWGGGGLDGWIDIASVMSGEIGV